MKKIAIYIITLFILLALYGIPTLRVLADSDSYLDTPDVLDVSQNETTLKISLKKQLPKDTRIILSVPETLNLSQKQGVKNDVKVSLTLSTNILYDGQSAYITLTHDHLTAGSWAGKVPVNYTLEKYKEVKTVYAYKTIVEWDDTPYNTAQSDKDIKKTQYGYKEAVYDYETLHFEPSDDGFYQEKRQYGYESRTATPSMCENVGLSGGQGTENLCDWYCKFTFGQDAYTNWQAMLDVNFVQCGCVFNEACTLYSEWALNNDSWRFNLAYSEDDVTKPVDRVVYYYPSYFKEATGWRDEPYESSNTILPVEREAYFTPSKYSELSKWSDKEIKEDKNTIVVSKQVYRVKENGVWGEWMDY